MTQRTQQKENYSKTSINNCSKSSANKKQENEEENKVFDIVLVDIKESRYNIKCVKKNISDPQLKYICISYRWGELNEQLLETLDYTAHITSFDLEDLKSLCDYIKDEPDLRYIPYLWIDAISVDQQNKDEKKETILKMNQIYQNATYILAVPDLHKGYFMKHPAYRELIYSIIKYQETIYNEILNNERLDNNNSKQDDRINSLITTDSLQQPQHHTNNDYYLIIQKLKDRNVLNEAEIKKIEELKIENTELKTGIIETKNKKIKEDKIIIYQFLAYLIEDWSNRAWVISEYHIAKEKYIEHGTPLKYMFLSLYSYQESFFSYRFNDDDQQNPMNDKILTYEEVKDPILFHQFIKSKFMEQSHLESILNAKVTVNEDRFNAILPSWNRYKHVIKNKNTISDWNITDMTSVRLKLYEIMDDLWDKALLLLACRYGKILPTFASNCHKNNQGLFEKLDYNHAAYKAFEVSLLWYISNAKGKEEADKIKQAMDEYHEKSKSIWKENLISIQFKPNHGYLSVKSKYFFIRKEVNHHMEHCRNKLSLDDGDEICQILIPFFTCNLSGYDRDPTVYQRSSKIYLIGNEDKNKWMLLDDSSYNYESGDFRYNENTFNIY